MADASTRTKIVVAVGVVLAIPSIGYIDSITGLVPDLTVLYVLPMVAVVYVFGLWPALATAFAAVLTEVVASPGNGSVPFAAIAADALLHMLVFTLVIVGGDRLLHELRAVRRLQEQRAADIRLASEMQHGLAQAGGTARKDIEVASLLRFKHEVGGDYFHFQDLGTRRSFFCIADISGSGMTAALFTSLLDQAVREALDHFIGLDELIIGLNARVHGVVPTNMFVTMCCGLVEPNTLSWINAGHEPLFLWRDANGRVENLLTENAIPLGILDDYPGRESVTGLGARDLLLLVTDGVTESPRFIDDPFPQLSGLVADYGRRGARPADVVDGIYQEALTGQPEETSDDIAVLAIRDLRPSVTEA